VSSYQYRLGANKLGFQARLTVFQKHGDYFLHVLLQFVERLALGVCAGETGDVSNIEVSIRATFDDYGKRSHGITSPEKEQKLSGKKSINS
jgi:hypothetical protein